MVDLEMQLEQPVIINDRAIKYAQLEPGSQLQYETRSEPLRTALRKLLAPLGLKATVESEALVITADHGELVHRNIGTDQWINVDNEMMEKAEDQLGTFLNASYVESPLREVVSELSASLKLPIMIDTRSLEEIGLDSDTPVSCELDSVSAYDLISLLLRDLDLTLSVRNNLHVVMSVETAEECLLSRVYWLEGLGLAGQYDSIIQSIESTVVPDTWEALGGSSTLVPAPGGRPGMVVSTTYIGRSNG